MPKSLLTQQIPGSDQCPIPIQHSKSQDLVSVPIPPHKENPRIHIPTQQIPGHGSDQCQAMDLTSATSPSHTANKSQAMDLISAPISPHTANPRIWSVPHPHLTHQIPGHRSDVILAFWQLRSSPHELPPQLRLPNPSVAVSPSQ